MFNAYPQQDGWVALCGRVRRCRFVLYTVLLGGIFLALMGGLELTSSRRVSSEDFRGLQVRQPFLASTGFEVGLWTRLRGSDQEPSDAPSAKSRSSVNTSSSDLPPEMPESIEEAAVDIKAASMKEPKEEDEAEEPRLQITETSRPSPHPAVREAEDLRKKLEAERARAAAQEAELVRLRESIQVAAVATRQSSEGIAAPAAPGDAPLLAEEADIPVSLWREPPGSGAASDHADSLQATTTTHNSVVSTSPSADETQEEPPQVIVRTQGEGGGIVVKIGRADDHQQYASAPAPAVPGSEASSTVVPQAHAQLDSPAASAEGRIVAGADEVSSSPAPAGLTHPPASEAPDAGHSQESTTTQLEPKMVSKSDSSSRITVKTDTGEIIVQINNDPPENMADREHAEKRPEEAVAPAPAATTTVTLPAAAYRGAPSTANAGIAGAVDSEEELVTTSTSLLKSLDFATTSTPIRAPETNKVSEDDDAPSKPSKSTQITVKSAGQSITIEVRGDERAEAPALTTTLATTSTTSTEAPVPSTTSASPTTMEPFESASEDVDESRHGPMAPLIPRPDAIAKPSDIAHRSDGSGCNGGQANCRGGAESQKVSQEKVDAAKADSYANLALRAR